MPSKRPVNLDLTKFAFPLIAIVSIVHRISGVVIFLFLPFLLYFLDQSLSSQAGFDGVVALFTENMLIRLCLLLFLTALLYHLLAGIKHLLADFGIGEELASARLLTYVFLAVMAVLVIILFWSLFL